MGSNRAPVGKKKCATAAHSRFAKNETSNLDSKEVTQFSLPLLNLGISSKIRAEEKNGTDKQCATPTNDKHGTKEKEQDNPVE